MGITDSQQAFLFKAHKPLPRDYNMVQQFYAQELAGLGQPLGERLLG